MQKLLSLRLKPTPIQLGDTISVMAKLTKERQIEIVFITVLSVVVLVTFYTFISMNGLVLGNDPSVHLKKAQEFLQTGQIPIVNLGWMPPLYDILLSMFIAITGATTFGQSIFLLKALATIMNWLLFMAIYLLGSKFFNKKVGAAASMLLLFCVPMYELNAFGGYTTVLGLAFLFLLFLYTTLSVKQLGYLVVTFFVAFSVVLSHQLTAFLAVFIMLPILLLMLIKSKGAHLKVVIALVLGGGIAFFLYYFQAMIGYLDVAIYYVFFAVKTYLYQIPYTNAHAFLVDYGFILFFAVAGVGISFLMLKRAKKMTLYVTLMLSLLVPLFFAESYLFGFLVPFQWFMYYVTPPLAILAAVALVFVADKIWGFCLKNRASLHKNRMKIVVGALIILMSVMLVFRGDTVYGSILGNSVYYSTSDIKAYDAGVWLNQNYPDNTTVVVTEVPGFWFSSFSNKTVIAQTDHTVERNEIAESVLSLSDEIQTPQTLLRAYQAKGDITDECYVSIDQVWYRVSFYSGAGEFISFNQNGMSYTFSLSDLSRQISFNQQSSPKQVTFTYTNDYVKVTQTMLVKNDSYPINVAWSVTPLSGGISNASLYLTTFFDLQFNFTKAQIPGLMEWINPWDVPTKGTGSNWAVVTFGNTTLKDNYIGLFDSKKDTAFGFKFTDLPDWGNIGALANHQIDAVRFQYNFNQIGANQTVTRQYQVLTLTQSSYPTLQPDQLEGLFAFKPEPFTISTRDFANYITTNNIQFIVYDKNKLDPNMLHCKFLQLIYSNDRFVIFKIVNSYNDT